jgi:hypothetical protein
MTVGLIDPRIRRMAEAIGWQLGRAQEKSSPCQFGLSRSPSPPPWRTPMALPGNSYDGHQLSTNSSRR